MERILGKIEGEMPGPVIICVAGLHGNEQIGLHAFRNVYSSILNHKIPLRGKLIGIAGNIKAIQDHRRFIDTDMNRVWTKKNIQRLLKGESPIGRESDEVKELYELIEKESAGNYTLKVLADLHATSSDNGNFIVVPEQEGSHAVIDALRLPIVLEMNKYLQGTLLAYYYERGFISFAFEGGMIGSQEVYRLHTSGIWEILEKSGAITRHDHENEDHYVSQLEQIAKDLPKKVIARYHHRVDIGDGFRMLPGFKNFQSIHKGQQLAIDLKGPIYAKLDGMIFMPLYQTEGEDGFFIVQEIIENILS